MGRFVLIVLLSLWVYVGEAIACSPPPPLSVVEGPGGTLVPYQEPSYYAFLGKVVGHTRNGQGAPALSVEVIDAWTTRQKIGEVVIIAVQQWQGCGLKKAMGELFQPQAYPLGTRLRIVSRDSTMFTWDVKNGISVLGVAP